MAMWAVMGVGLLINTIQGLTQGNQMRNQIQQMQRQTDAMKGNLDLLQRDEPELKSPITFDFKVPDYPEKSFNNLQQMQTQHYGERQNLQQNLQNELGQMKQEFFEENHYATKFGNDGKPEVALDQQGRPQVEKGPENPQQRLAREGFETAKRNELATKHADQRESFTKNETTNVKQFLAQNQGALHDPILQGELQRMVVDSKKKALKLQQDQEDERWKIDLPPTGEILAKADSGLSQLRDMEQRHAQAEEGSEDLQALLDYDRDMAQAMAAEREAARSQKQQDNFLMDPRQMMAAANAQPKNENFSEVLPAYLTNALFDMGIYSV